MEDTELIKLVARILAESKKLNLCLQTMRKCGTFTLILPLRSYLRSLREVSMKDGLKS